MNDLNQCSFIGRLGRDPEVRYMPDGGAVANFSIACGWKTSEKEGAEWVRIVAFGKLGEICGEYLKKGAQVFIQGRIQTRKWTDKDGADKYTTEIVADKMQMLGSKRDGAAARESEATAGGEPAAEPKRAPAKATGGKFDDFEDDIPF